VHKLDITGNTYNLNDISDFPGGYFQARIGLTVVKGAGGIWIKNTKGVAIHLTSHADGVALALGVDGINIELQ
jgi:hypothetical protein